MSENINENVNENGISGNAVMNANASVNANANVSANINNGAFFNMAPDNSYMNQTYYMNNYVKPESELLKQFKKDFPFFCIATIIYALFYTFCLYQNSNGITAPFYAVSSVVYYYVCLRKLGINLPKDLWFYVAVIALLGINLCITTDTVLVTFDHIGIWLVVGSGLLHAFFKDDKWGLGKYLGALVTTGVYGIGHGFLSIEDSVTYMKNRNKETDNRKFKVFIYVLIGVVVAIPLLIIVTVLLASADKFFGDFVENILNNISFELFDIDNFGAVFMFLAIAVISYGVVRFMTCKSISEEVIANRKLNAIAAITLNALTSVIYLIFSCFQIFYLFLGKMTLPEDYSFAEYAREGFFQLVVVCLINMVIVLAELYLFENTRVLKATLLVITGCTYIMIASSTMRMIMYVQVYQLTYTRVFVFFALTIIFMIVNGISIYIFKKEFPIFRYSMIVTAVLYLIFAFSNPCGLIARNNLSERFCNGNGDVKKYAEIDFSYINRHLGTDASNAVSAAIERENSEEFNDLIDDYYRFEPEQLSFRTFNFSKYSYERNYNNF